MYGGGRYGSRGGGRGGYGGGSRGGRRGGRGSAPRGRGGRGDSEGRGSGSEAQREKRKPMFQLLDKLFPGTAGFVLVKVGEVKCDAQRQARGRGRGAVVNITCTQAQIGDHTGWMHAYTTVDEIAKFLKDNEGKTVALMNVRPTNVEGVIGIELDKFSTLKTLEQVQEEKLLKEGTNTEFEINQDMDLTSKRLRKPIFSDIGGLKPERKGVNVIGKVASVKISEKESTSGSNQRVAEAVIGTDKNSINLIARCSDLSALEVGNVVVILNGKVEMYNQSQKIAHMRLGAGMWSCIKPLKEVEKSLQPISVPVPTEETTVNTEANRSNGTWELQE